MEVKAVEVLRIEVGKLELRDGDVLVARIPQGLSMDVHQRVQECLQRVILDSGVEATTLVMEEGVELSVIRKGDD